MVSGLVWSGLVVWAGYVWSCLVESGLVVSGLVMSGHVWLCLVVGFGAGEERDRREGKGRKERNRRLSTTLKSTGQCQQLESLLVMEVTAWRAKGIWALE